MAKKKLHIEPSDIEIATVPDCHGGFDYACFIEKINTKKAWNKCVLIEDIMVEEHHVMCDVGDFEYIERLNIKVKPLGNEFTEDELATWIADAINEVL